MRLRNVMNSFALALLLGAALAVTAAAQVTESPRRDRENMVRQGSHSIEGTVTWRDRVRTPANAILEVTLEDVSRTGAQSEIVARVRNEQPGSSPIPFTLSYDASRVRIGRRYAVRASLIADGQVWFTTTQAYPVLTDNRDNVVDMFMRRVGGGGGGQQNPPAPEPMQLEDTYWRLTAIGTTAVRGFNNQREANIVLRPGDHRVTGSTGCNQISGNYQTVSNWLSFSQLTTTKMACQDAMQVENLFLQALGRTRHWKVTGERLDLLDTSNRIVATFEASRAR